MTTKLRIYVGSVSMELEDERLILQNLMNTDPFLSASCIPLLSDCEPASPGKALEGCLQCLDGCQVCLLLIGVESAAAAHELSIPHAEYRRARERGLPILAFIKGDRSIRREGETAGLLKELDADGLECRGFGNIIELQKEVRDALVALLRDRYEISPTSDEDDIAESTIEATSVFESRPLDRVRWCDLDMNVVRTLLASAQKCSPGELSEEDLLAGAILRGLAWYDSSSGEHYATAAGIVLLAKDPSAVFPQCRILADAYRSAVPDGDPRDHEDIRGPMPVVIERAIGFIDRNTRHPMRVVGLNRIRLDEYPVDGLREALVNAVAHRQYEDAGRKIILEVFPDRVVISSPGLPPRPITLASLRRGRYRPCSRNPVLAQCLSYFHRIEERGSGFRRMRDHMLNHGLDLPLLSTDMGYFQVTFPGPGEDIDLLRVPDRHVRFSPAAEAQLNERQRKMLQWLAEGQELTSRQCEAEFGVSRPITAGDFGLLVKLGLAEKLGGGRSTRYRLKSRDR
ncbi:MAG: hypothetical protein A4E70_01212 [Syntrophus sp. PtaU1.Bin005]|nr:MAG: hypothetical protein A4E70_01212 [Syntrophus sp. PtaU1.Bin005]